MSYCARLSNAVSISKKAPRHSGHQNRSDNVRIDTASHFLHNYRCLWSPGRYLWVRLLTRLASATELPMSVSKVAAPGPEPRAVRVGAALQQDEFLVATAISMTP